MKITDLTDLLLGKAIRYFKSKNVDFKYYDLLREIDLIVDNNIQYESYDLESMIKDLWKYCIKCDTKNIHNNK